MTLGKKDTKSERYKDRKTEGCIIQEYKDRH